MQELNYLADNNLIEPAVVAEQFLIEHNYFSGVMSNARYDPDV